MYGGFYLSEQPTANKAITTTAATAQPITPPGTLASSLLTTRPRTLKHNTIYIIVKWVFDVNPSFIIKTEK